MWVGEDVSGVAGELIPPWYGAPGGDDEPVVAALGEREADALVHLVRALRAGPVERAGWVPVFAWAERALRAGAGRPASRALWRLFQTLMYAPDPDRWTIAEALEAVFGVRAGAPPADELTGYVELDLWRAGDQPAAEIARLFDTVEEAISRARGWLGGGSACESVGRYLRGDRAAAAAGDVESGGGGAVPQVLRFARDVYEACLRRGRRCGWWWMSAAMAWRSSGGGVAGGCGAGAGGGASGDDGGAALPAAGGGGWLGRGAWGGGGAVGGGGAGEDGALAAWAQARWDEVGGSMGMWWIMRGWMRGVLPCVLAAGGGVAASGVAGGGGVRCAG
ncbi:MAG: hypothetical protein R3F65_10305 [bacterium]